MAWSNYIEEKHIQQQDVHSANITPGDTLGMVVITIISILAIVGVFLAIKKTREATTHRNSSEQYKRLEAFALWRFSKLLFWVIVVVTALFLMLYQDYYAHYTLARLGVVLLVFSYPLYMLFRHASLYIAYGKSERKRNINQ